MRRRLLIPEVLQSSAMDCGPACLSALLGGFDRHASYGRLREACQTSIDGTSIDALDQLANRMGLETEQIVLPADHVAIPQAAALPAIAVVKLPSGVMHFVVVWRRHGRRLQVMDPVTGRHFIPIDEFTSQLFLHSMVVPAAAWREWAESSEFVDTLNARMLCLGISSANAAFIIEQAMRQSGWRAIATVDAAVRMLQSFASAGTVSSPAQIAQLLQTVVSRALETHGLSHDLIPDQYWSAQQHGLSDASDEQLLVRGAVLVRAKGRRTGEIDLAALPPDIAVAVSERTPHELAALWQFLRCDGALTPAMVAGALFVSALGIIAQALLFRGLIEGARDLSQGSERITVVISTVVLLLLLTIVEIPAISILTDMGRRLETRFREAFFKKLPTISDSYFHSRLTSDMAERGHSVFHLRTLPGLAGQLLHSFFQLLLTSVALIWLDPGLWAPALASTLLAVGLPVAFQPLLGEKDLRVRTHGGALSRFYFDALLGLIPIRTHTGSPALRGEHRNLLRRWTGAALDRQRLAIALDGVQMFAGYGCAALLTILYAARHNESSALLLVAYWSLNLPGLGRELATLATEYPLHRSIALRLLEPLGAVQESRALRSSAEVDGRPAGVRVSMQRISTIAGGHTILRDLNIEIPAGSHLAIVGQSGAGKSSFAGLMLGLTVPDGGELLIDGEPLTDESLARLRRETAWIDPTVQLWNRSLVENLRFGLAGEAAMPLGESIEDAELLSLIDTLPDGLQTRLGEGGALVSGGEGQRVRIGRALLRSGVRLAILDEPFRGLDASTRQELLRRLRRVWRAATLIFISHQVRETQSFDRVLVMRAGTVIEDGAPAELLQTPGSHYAALFDRELEFESRLLGGAEWRRLRMQQGTLSEQGSAVLRARNMPARERTA